MTSPRLGVVRTSMMTNPRIIKAPLGEARSSNLSYPGQDFTYGIRNRTTDGQMDEILSGWQVHTKKPNRVVLPNFMCLNRDAVRSGLVTSKELSQYRALRARIPKPAPKLQRSESPVVADITYGIRTSRPASPLSNLLSHEYSHRWQEEQLRRSQSINRQLKERMKPRGIQETRTTVLRGSRLLPVTETQFKLSRFSQVPCALDTFRDPRARVLAFSARQ